MMRPSYLSEVSELIKKDEAGKVYILSDFEEITNKRNLTMVFSRMESNGLVKRIMRGVYYKPEYNKFLDECVEPNPFKVAKAIARNYGWTIVPCGDTVLNMLGLSTQVPAVWSYVSDGPYKEYAYNNTKIKFKHIANKEISKLSYKTSLIIQALKTLGKNNIDDTVINRLSEVLSKEEKEEMIEETKTVTSWIYEYIKIICKR